MALPIEFMPEALADLEDLPRVARLLSRQADLGRIACGQADPMTREVVIDQHRLLYRVEREQIVVLSAEPTFPIH